MTARLPLLVLLFLFAAPEPAWTVRPEPPRAATEKVNRAKRKAIARDLHRPAKRAKKSPRQATKVILAIGISLFVIGLIIALSIGVGNFFTGLFAPLTGMTVMRSAAGAFFAVRLGLILIVLGAVTSFIGRKKESPIQAATTEEPPELTPPPPPPVSRSEALADQGERNYAPLIAARRRRVQTNAKARASFERSRREILGESRSFEYHWAKQARRAFGITAVVVILLLTLLVSPIGESALIVLGIVGGLLTILLSVSAVRRFTDLYILRQDGELAP